MAVRRVICNRITRIMSPSPIPRAVLEAAARLVAEQGRDGLTMARLARATGLSRATLYRQTGGREAVLDALAATGADVGDRTDARARILLGAREVFGRVGFEAAAIDDIARAASVGVATIYRHFGDKDGLVATFLDELAPRRAAREARSARSGDLRCDLERLAEQMLTGMRDDASLVRLLILETLRGGSLLARVRAKSPTRVSTAVASLLREHCAAGRLRDVDPHRLAQAFGGMLFAFGVLAPILRGEPASDPRETARLMTELFLFGAVPRKELKSC
jgi:AcrR family transcriptional regulator